MNLVTSISAPGFARPSALTPSEWAAKFRRLPETSAAAGARWRNEMAPYLSGIMDVFVEPGVRHVAILKSAQAGVSEALLNVAAYHIGHRPCPMLWCLPTASAAGAFSKDRVADLLRSTPEIGRLVTDKRRHSKDGIPESTLVQRLFPGGQLVTIGASTPNAFARWSARIVCADDCDRIPRVVGAEGDPAKLLMNRVQTFHDGIACFASTPVSAAGRISTMFAQSDMRRWFLTCPGCGESTWTTWSDRTRWFVRFDGRDPATARLEHGPCGYAVTEAGRMDLVRGGTWQATAEAPGRAGFHVPAMVSPFVTLAQLVDKFLAADAQGTPRRLMEFVTTCLGEGWKSVADEGPDEAELIGRMEDSYV